MWSLRTSRSQIWSVSMYKRQAVQQMQSCRAFRNRVLLETEETSATRQKLISLPRWSGSVVRSIFRYRRFGTGLCVWFTVQHNNNHHWQYTHSGHHWFRCVLQCIEYSRFRETSKSWTQTFHMQQNAVSIQFSASQSNSVSGRWCSVPRWSIGLYLISHCSRVPVFTLGKRNCWKVANTEDCQPSVYSVSTGVKKPVSWQIPWSLWGSRKAQKPPCQIAHWQISTSSS